MGKFIGPSHAYLQRKWGLRCVGCISLLMTWGGRTPALRASAREPALPRTSGRQPMRKFPFQPRNRKFARRHEAATPARAKPPFIQRLEQTLGPEGCATEEIRLRSILRDIFPESRPASQGQDRIGHRCNRRLVQQIKTNYFTPMKTLLDKESAPSEITTPDGFYVQ